MRGRHQFSSEQCMEIQRITGMIDRKYGTGAWQPGEVRLTAKAPVLLAGKSGTVPELMFLGLLVRRTAGNQRQSGDRRRECIVPETRVGPPMRSSVHGLF